MARKQKKRRVPSVRPRGRPVKPRPLSKPVAFRLPDDVIGMADKAAYDQHVSRNKLVEIVLRAALEPGYAKKPEIVMETADAQFDLFA